jgi:thioredoxin 1
MNDDAISQVDDLNFELQVVASGGRFLLEFGARWCAPCRAMLPALRALALENVGRLSVGVLDIEQAPAAVQNFGIRGAPTLVLFERGIERKRQLGAMNLAQLRKFVADGAPVPAQLASRP